MRTCRPTVPVMSTQVEESGLAFRPLVVDEREVEAEDRYVGGARLYHPGAFHLAGQVVHGGVDFLVHLDKGQVGGGAVVEVEADDARPVAGLAMDVAQARHLHQLLADGLHDGILQFAGGGVGAR